MKFCWQFLWYVIINSFTFYFSSVILKLESIKESKLSEEDLNERSSWTKLSFWMASSILGLSSSEILEHIKSRRIDIRHHSFLLIEMFSAERFRVRTIFFRIGRSSDLDIEPPQALKTSGSLKIKECNISLKHFDFRTYILSICSKTIFLLK